MKKIASCLFLIFFFYHFTLAQNFLLWDGETDSIHSCEFEFGIADSIEAHSGQWCFKGSPDQWHSPAINLGCQNTWRSDISSYDEIWFYAKANIPGKTLKFSLSECPYTSRLINIAPYISGGVLDTIYKLVRIPIDSLKTSDSKLKSIEFLYFDTCRTENYHIFIDDIVAIDTKPIQADSILALSDQAIRISVSGKYDTSDATTLSNYYITSPDDADFSSATNPIKVGMHYYVYKFSSDGPYPYTRQELFLFFNNHLKNGKTYQLTINNIKDRAGNDFPEAQVLNFTFDDQLIINHSVKVNQVGYLPYSPKYAYVGNYLGSAGMMECSPENFEIRDVLSNNPVHIGTPVFKTYDSILSGEKIYECDFSSFHTSGNYYLYVPGIGRSYSFVIDTTAYDSVYYTTARSLFYQRCGTALTVPYADARFVHGACHMDDGTSHTSQGDTPLYNGEPLNALVPMPGGWHDAGDYGKYIPTAAGALFNMFTAYELYPEKFKDDELNIPESGNNVPDILDEAKWEIDWFKEMQTPDGGVYFKITTTDWASGMPENDIATRYIAQKTTHTTGMYAAVMSMAYRNFYPYWPAYADTCLERAKRAMNFLLAHPDVDPADGFVNPPGIGGGAYGDPSGDVDERAWAAAELYKSTGETMYDSLFAIYWAAHPPNWGWNSFQHHQINASLAYATTNTFVTDSNKVNAFKADYINDFIHNLITRTDSNYYHNAYRSDVLQWIGWGIFAQSSIYSWNFIIAYYLTGDKKHIEYAKVNLGTQLGLNPQDRSYITGVGKNYPKDPLQDPSIYDSIDEPVPGIPVFGPAAHMSFANSYDAAAQGRANLYPKGEHETDPYPILRRYFDCHENVMMSEFSIEYISYISCAFAYFKSMVNDTPTNYTNLPSSNTFQLTNCPNPYSQETTFSFLLNKPDAVTLSIYDVYGKLVAVLINKQLLSIGVHKISFNTQLPAGVYLSEIKSTSGKALRKIIQL